MHVEFAVISRELVKAEVFEKRVVEQTAPLKYEEKMKGAFSLNNLLVGTGQPPQLSPGRAALSAETALVQAKASLAVIAGRNPKQR